jgi:hypothetical protein
LDQWIDEENVAPAFDDVNEQYISQSKISLDRYVV